MKSNDLHVWVVRAAYQAAKEFHRSERVASLSVDHAGRDFRRWIDDLRGPRAELRRLHDNDTIKVRWVEGLAMSKSRVLEYQIPDSDWQVLLADPDGLKWAIGSLIETIGDRQAFLLTGFTTSDLRIAAKKLNAE